MVHQHKKKLHVPGLFHASSLHSNYIKVVHDDFGYCPLFAYILLIILYDNTSDLKKSLIYELLYHIV